MGIGMKRDLSVKAIIQKRMQENERLRSINIKERNASILRNLDPTSDHHKETDAER